MIDLRPYTQELIISPGDSWVFPFIFRQKTGMLTTSLDVSAYSFEAVLFQQINGIWVPFDGGVFVRKAGSPTANAIETGIYLDATDPSKVVFVADWEDNTANNQTLSEGNYRLDLKYSTDLGYDKRFFRYVITLSDEVSAVNVQNTEVQALVVFQNIENTINIYNTIL